MVPLPLSGPRSPLHVPCRYSDSQLVKLLEEPDAAGNFVSVVEVYESLGPIIDLCVVDLERQGQGQVVTCSGASKDASLRVVRSGIGIEEQVGVWDGRPREGGAMGACCVRLADVGECVGDCGLATVCV